MVLAINLLAVRKWRAAGHSLVITTRHSYAELDDILPDWQKFVDYVVTDDGGAVFDNLGQCVYTCRLELRLVRAIQSLVCDCALPMNHGINRCSIELLLSETIIKLRLYFRTATLYQRYKERIRQQNWPIKILPWPKPTSSKLPGGTDLSQFYGYLDILPETGGEETALKWLTHTIYASQQHIIITDASTTQERVADIIYQHL